MDKIPFEIRNILEKYLEVLSLNNIKLKSAFLFGSYSKGNANEFSDIDVAIVSDSFEGIRIKDRERIRKITLSVSTDLEVIPFSSENFSTDDPLAREIIETGIPLPIN